MNIFNIILMDCTLETSPSTVHLSQQEGLTLAVRGRDRVKEEIYVCPTRQALYL